MNDIKINSMVKLHTLCLLADGPKYGYEIIKELENSLNRNISASHVYPFLKSLEERKLINCKRVEERDKKTYYLTEPGEDFVSMVLEKTGNIINTIIEKKLCSCDGCGCRVYEGAHNESVNGITMNFCCKHCADAHKQKVFFQEESTRPEIKSRL